ncbi:MAG: hypothetical protein ACOCV3_05515, partial [Halanaerobiales bacterium]
NEQIQQEFFDRQGIEVETLRGPEVVVQITSNLGQNLHHLTSKPVQDIKVLDPSLEEVFLSYYGSD